MSDKAMEVFLSTLSLPSTSLHLQHAGKMNNSVQPSYGYFPDKPAQGESEGEKKRTET